MDTLVRAIHQHPRCSKLDVDGLLSYTLLGDVYRGIWQNSITVAVKKLKLPEYVIQFEKEAFILQYTSFAFSHHRALSHPNIVQFFGIYYDGKENYLVTEFMDGGNLSELFEQRRQKNASFSTEELVEMYSRHCTNALGRSMLLLGCST